MTYVAPLDDMRFVLNELCNLPGIANLPGYEETTPELTNQILDEAARLAGQVWAPLNQSGDREGCLLENGVVRTPKGFVDAYGAYVEGGWNGLAIDSDHGGMGLPSTLATAVQEMWHGSNLALGLCPLLTLGAIQALITHADPALRAAYLPKLTAGKWTATMNLTEPQAGSDLGEIRTRAVRDGDRFRIHGQKIYITFGEHDLAENIIHLVLARAPDGAPGTGGLGLYLVPKFLPDGDGNPGVRNDLRCVSLEHKLGIHGSPTAVMAYGDNDGAIGYQVGDEFGGIACMFTMMNAARIAVGLQGVGVAERAYQRAVEYARTRVQSRPLNGGKQPVAIIQHPDVRRMLLTMRALTEAARAVTYYTTAQADIARRHPDAAARDHANARVELLTPIVKAWCTDISTEVASLGIQVHGGMGYIEETGAAQHWRDARITPIYEGTNGIQANDLLGRKLLRDQGAAMHDLIAELQTAATAFAKSPATASFATTFAPAVGNLEAATAWLLDHGARDLNETFAGATAYLHLTGQVVGAWLMGRAASAGGDTAFVQHKQLTADYFASAILPQTNALRAAITGAASAVLEFPENAY